MPLGFGGTAQVSLSQAPISVDEVLPEGPTFDVNTRKNSGRWRRRSRPAADSAQSHVRGTATVIATTAFAHQMIELPAQMVGRPAQTARLAIHCDENISMAYQNRLVQRFTDLATGFDTDASPGEQDKGTDRLGHRLGVPRAFIAVRVARHLPT